MATYRLVDASILEAKSILPYGQVVTSRHALDELLGNHNGRFCTNGRNFSNSAKEVTLQGSRLSAQLRRVDANWVQAAVELMVEPQEISGDWTHQLFLRGGCNVFQKWPVHSSDTFSRKQGWNLRLQGTSYLFRDFPPTEARSNTEDREIIARAIDLDTRLGNRDGRFDVLGRRFSATARRVRLAGTVLHAELRAISGEWKEDQVDLCWMTEVWRLAEGAPSVQAPTLSTKQGKYISPTVIRLYAPLPPGKEFIRVCYIQPGTWDEEIHCRMLSRPMDLDESYKCLSYVWGSSQDGRRTVHVNSKPVVVTENLFNALRSIRSLGVAGAIWIDALCIDQNNLSERGTQVAMMARIYGKAQQVIISLGQLEPVIVSGRTPPTHSPKLLSILLSRFLISMDRDLHVRDAIREALSPFPELAVMEAKSIVALWTVVDACIRLVSTEWFGRVWTLQEYIFARDAVFVVSDEVLGTETVKHALENWNHHRRNCCSRDEVGYERMMMTDSMVERKDFPRMYDGIIGEITRFHNQYSFFEGLKEDSRIACLPPALCPEPQLVLDCAIMLLHNARRNQSSDPRDKIFAFTNIAVKAFGSFKPDYTMLVDQVYTGFALRLVQEMRNFDIWCLGEVSEGIPDTRLPNLPSWVIDWTQDITLNMSYRYLQKGNAVGPSLTYCPSGELFHHVSEGVIEVHAGRLDEISSISSNTTNGRSIDPWVITGSDALTGLPPDPTFVLSSIHFVGIVDLNNMVKQSARWDQLWRTLLGDQFPLHPPYEVPVYGGSDIWRSLTSEDEKVVKELAVKAQLWPDGVLETKLSVTEQLVSDVIRMNVGGRYLFTTLDGRLGLCPARAQPGDGIFYIAGSRWPVLLRPNSAHVDQRGDHAFSYMLVGICFVQGVSHEEVQTILDRGIRVRLF